MPPMSKIELYAAIRRDARAGLSGRAIESKYHVTRRPGVEAEVDFGEVQVNLRGTPVTCMLFAFRMSYSGKAVHRIFISGGQEAFLEGHVHAFTVLGGVPTGQVRYDNLRSAVARV